VRDGGKTADWIQAGDLVAGEEIETHDGKGAAVQSVTPVAGPDYNLASCSNPLCGDGLELSPAAGRIVQRFSGNPA
jgi:hypothetical protein